MWDLVLDSWFASVLMSGIALQGMILHLFLEDIPARVWGWIGRIVGFVLLLLCSFLFGKDRQEQGESWGHVWAADSTVAYPYSCEDLPRMIHRVSNIQRDYIGRDTVDIIYFNNWVRDSVADGDYNYAPPDSFWRSP